MLSSGGIWHDLGAYFIVILCWQVQTRPTIWECRGICSNLVVVYLVVLWCVGKPPSQWIGLGGKECYDVDSNDWEYLLTLHDRTMFVCPKKRAFVSQSRGSTRRWNMDKKVVLKGKFCSSKLLQGYASWHWVGPTYPVGDTKYICLGGHSHGRISMLTG
jgi:hypothetical protein